MVSKGQHKCMSAGARSHISTGFLGLACSETVWVQGDCMPIILQGLYWTVVGLHPTDNMSEEGPT